jgi:hypothetical protein
MHGCGTRQAVMLAPGLVDRVLKSRSLCTAEMDTCGRKAPGFIGDMELSFGWEGPLSL